MDSGFNGIANLFVDYGPGKRTIARYPMVRLRHHQRRALRTVVCEEQVNMLQEY